MNGNLLMLTLKAVQLNFLFSLFGFLQLCVMVGYDYLYVVISILYTLQVVHVYLLREFVCLFCFVLFFLLILLFASISFIFIFLQCDFLLPLCTCVSLFSPICFCALLPLRRAHVCVYERKLYGQSEMEHVKHSILSFYRFRN